MIHSNTWNNLTLLFFFKFHPFTITFCNFFISFGTILFIHFFINSLTFIHLFFLYDLLSFDLYFFFFFFNWFLFFLSSLSFLYFVFSFFYFDQHYETKWMPDISSQITFQMVMLTTNQDMELLFKVGISQEEV